MDGSHQPPETPRCAQCGAPLDTLDGGKPLECPRCWFGIALGDAGVVVGSYRLLGLLGEGGSAFVHLAERVATSELFALKVAKSGVAHAEIVFQNELRNARQLRGAGAGIVPIGDSGVTAEGRAFLVLELMEGGSLADAVQRGGYAAPRESLGLVGKLAGTLARAHAHAVLHCDIKPENVLFDAKGEPHLADFGVGQRLEELGSVEAGTFGGTRGWMSPEQARRRPGGPELTSDEPALSIATDVFSLGVLLYWLLTRTLPFGKDADFEQRVQHAELPAYAASRRWGKRLELDAMTICRRALAKDPAARYRSAADFADDVTRALSGLPLSEESSRPLRQVASWVSRHKLLALATFELAFLLLYLPLVPLLVLGQSRAVLSEQNSNAALHQAGAVMNELRDFSDNLRKMAENPEVQALVQRTGPAVVPALERFRTGNVDNFVLFSPDGVLRARWPVASTAPRSFNFAFRDYFQGAVGLASQGLREIYVARVINSQTTGKLELEPSTPIFDQAGKFVGVVGGSVPARSTFGAVQMNCAGASACVTGLLASRDRDDPGAPLSDRIIFIAAPELKTGQEVALDAALSRKLCARLGCTPAAREQFAARRDVRPLVEDFIDPVSGTPSLGAFAPVGSTGLIVVVATPHSAIRGLTDRMLDRARTYLGFPLLAGLSLFGALLASWYWRRTLGAGAPGHR